MKDYKKWWLIKSICSLLFNLQPYAQQVELLHSDQFYFSQKEGFSVRVLKGNVQFRYKGGLFFCDSAFHYLQQQIMEAYGNVQGHTPDSVHIYGHYLRYHIPNGVLQLKQNVHLHYQDLHLFAPQVVYYRYQRIATYYNGGTIQQDSLKIQSQKAKYWLNKDSVLFQKDVVVTHPQYRIKTALLSYAPERDKVFFVAPTTILFADSLVLQLQKGFFDRNLQYFFAYDSVVFQDSNGIVFCDTLHYWLEKQQGNMRCNIRMWYQDSTLFLFGDSAYFFNQDSFQMVKLSDNAYLLWFSEQGDTAMVLADTLAFEILKEKRRWYSYWHVQFFHKDLQAIADSMVYQDSLLTLLGSPVLWMANGQLTADTVWLWQKQQQWDSLHGRRHVFLLQQDSALHFHQVRSSEIGLKFYHNEPYAMHFFPRVESIYFIKDQGRYVAVNQVETPQLWVYFYKNKPQRITLVGESQGVLYPYSKEAYKRFRLKGFQWLVAKRPKAWW